jgi:hypothetical protein
MLLSSLSGGHLASSSLKNDPWKTKIAQWILSFFEWGDTGPKPSSKNIRRKFENIAENFRCFF